MEGVEAAAAGSGSHGLHGQSRNLERVLVGVAIHAAARPLHHHPGIVAGNVEDVEHGPQFGVDRGHLDLPAGHVAQVQIVAEVEGPRIARVDQAQLQAGVGEDEQLRGLRNAQGLEDAFEEGPFTGAVQGKAAFGQFRNPAAEAVLRRSLEVAVGLGIQVRLPFRGQYRSQNAHQSDQCPGRGSPWTSSIQRSLHGLQGVTGVEVGQISRWDPSGSSTRDRGAGRIDPSSVV